MPMIEVTYPEGAIAADARDGLLEELATSLLRAEKAPDTEFFRSITWVYAKEIRAGDLYVGGKPGGEPRFRVDVTVPEGALSDRRKGVLIEAVQAAFKEHVGLTDEQALHLWTIVREVTDGNWGAAGQQIRYSQLVDIAAGEREKDAVPAT